MRPMKNNQSSHDTITDICAKYQNNPAALIEILHDIQENFGFIPENLHREIADRLNITRAEIHGVISFYEDFKTSKGAKTKLKICKGEACQALGANELIKQAKEQMSGLEEDICFEEVYCLGNCALAPAMMRGEKLYGRINRASLEREINKSKGPISS